MFKMCGGLMLDTALTLSILPTPVANAAGEGEMGIVAEYDMTHKAGYLTDKSGNGNHAKLNEITYHYFTEEDGAKILNLVDGQYVELPAGFIE